MKTCPVQLARGVGFGCLAARCVAAFGMVELDLEFKQQLTCWEVKKDWTLQDKVVPYKIQSMDTDNGFYSSKMIACYSAMRGQKVVLFGCLSYYLAYVISFLLSGMQTLFSPFKA